MSFFKKIFCTLFNGFNNTLDFLTPVGDLFLRFWIARVFFLAGLTKIQTWDVTVQLFTYEYEVPVLSPTIAAALGTATELVVPVFLLLGLGRRVPAFILFVFNIMAVVSYPYLLTEEGQIGLNDHFYWGVLLLVLLLHGSGKLSLDYLFWRKEK